MKKYKTGIALSGGGVRGFAHLGVLKALNEKGIFPEMISGVSAGAIAGVFYASGREPEEIFNILSEKGLFRYSKIHLPKDGLLRLDGLKKELMNELMIDDLRELKIPFYAAVANLNEGRIEYFNEGPPEEIITASASIPILFSPIRINNSLYADGGLFNNLPVDPLVGQCKKIIGVNISPVHRIEKMTNMIQLAVRIFHLHVNSTIKEARALCDLYIEPPGLEKFDMLRVSHAREIYELGYKYTMGLEIHL